MRAQHARSENKGTRTRGTERAGLRRAPPRAGARVHPVVAGMRAVGEPRAPRPGALATKLHPGKRADPALGSLAAALRR